MNPWWTQQEWPCICNRGDRWIHVHYEDRTHPCARCNECKEYRPDIPEHVGIRILLGPEMSNKEATDILLGKESPAFVKCRFCSHAAVAIFSMPDGCACYPDDREQALCIQHVNRATPRGEMILKTILAPRSWEWYVLSLLAQ